MTREATEPSGVDMIQSIDCERGQDTSGRRYKKKPVTSDLDIADFLSIQEPSSPEGLRNTRCMGYGCRLLWVTKYQRLGNGGIE
jgi:hypothetical protein